MDKHALYDIWAPPLSIWSPWVKSAPFAHLPRPLPEIASTDVPQFDLGWVPAAGEGCALVCDLGGIHSIYFALQVAARGYRPVSLLNACPPPLAQVTPAGPAVNVDAQLAALVATAPNLTEIPLSPTAPPVFILDAERQATGRSIAPGMFDNRSVVFAADFPSATLLMDHGITRALIVHESPTPMALDLVHALRPWIRRGIRVELIYPNGSSSPMPWPGSGMFGEIWLRLRTLLTLRRNPSGGFGRFVPESSGG